MKFERDIRVKLFTHNDLDGIGCEVVGRLAFENDIDVTVVKNPQDASKKVSEFVKHLEYHNYDYIYITDISVDEVTANLIDAMGEGKFILLDHHGTAENLNKFNWATVRVNGHLGKEAGTSMFYYHLAEDGFFRHSIYRDALTCFVEKIRRYDCWEWKEKYNDLESASLNQLFWLIGREKFVNRYLSKFNTGQFFSTREGDWVEMFDKLDREIIKMDNAKKEAYIEQKNKQMFRMSFRGNFVGVVFAEQYISELGNALSEMNEELKYIVLIDMGSKRVSLRTIHSDIDLGKDVAKLFGGGGHAKASGFMFDETVLTKTVDAIFNPKKPSVLTKFIDIFTKK